MKEQTYDTLIEMLIEKINDLQVWHDIYKNQYDRLSKENEELKIRLGDIDDAEIL